MQQEDKGYLVQNELDLNWKWRLPARFWLESWSHEQLWLAQTFPIFIFGFLPLSAHKVAALLQIILQLLELTLLLGKLDELDNHVSLFLFLLLLLEWVLHPFLLFLFIVVEWLLVSLNCFLVHLLQLLISERPVFNLCTEEFESDHVLALFLRLKGWQRSWALPLLFVELNFFSKLGDGFELVIGADALHWWYLDFQQKLILLLVINVALTSLRWRRAGRETHTHTNAGHTTSSLDLATVDWLKLVIPEHDLLLNWWLNDENSWVMINLWILWRML